MGRSSCSTSASPSCSRATPRGGAAIRRGERAHPRRRSGADAGVRGAGAGDRRTGHHRDRRLCARRAPVRAAQRPASRRAGRAIAGRPRAGDRRDGDPRRISDAVVGRTETPRRWPQHAARCGDDAGQAAADAARGSRHDRRQGAEEARRRSATRRSRRWPTICGGRCVTSRSARGRTRCGIGPRRSSAGTCAAWR